MTKIKAIIKKFSCLKLVFSNGIEIRTLKKEVPKKLKIKVIKEFLKHFEIVTFIFLR